jgi:hypothetical protein
LPDPTLTDDNGCEPVADWFTPKFGDLPGGRDNGLRNLIEFVALGLPGFGTATYNQSIRSGDVSLLMEIRGYNEQPDDDAVEFFVYTPGSFGQLGNPEPPKFDGRDEWPVASASFIDGNSNLPRFVSSRAYVTNGTLVATLASFEFRLRIGISQRRTVDLILKFLDPFFTARIENQAGVWWLRDGQIAARWRTRDLFEQLKYFPDPFHDPATAATSSLCTKTGAYKLVRQAVCESADVYSGGITPVVECDAISVGIAFNAVQARLGGTVELPALQSDCGELDPARDSCDKTWDDLVAAGLVDPPPPE